MVVDPEYSLSWTETTRKGKIHRSQKTWRASNTSRSEPKIATVIAFLAWCVLPVSGELEYFACSFLSGRNWGLITVSHGFSLFHDNNM